MLLKRFHDEKLAQTSWLVGCSASGEALVVDPNRDVEQYIRAAEKEGLRVTHVTETHIHADFVSGSRELAARTGARLHLSDEGGAEWRYAWAEEAGAVLLRDGDDFMVGNIRVEAMHTPGHTPEHLSFIVTDTPATGRPMGMFTGDFVFAGDVGRPDLLERAAGHAGTMTEAARTLFRSLRRLASLPDYLQLWPGHGAGSACGKALGAVPSSTLGYERIANWALAIEDEDEFVTRVLEGQPEPPRYFAEMKRINREGPRLLHGVHRPERLPETRIASLIEQGALVVDARPAAEFAAGHIPGTISIPLDRSFTTWAGWLVPFDRDFHLLLREGHDAAEAVRDLAMIGLDRVAGIVGSDALSAWTAEGRALATMPQMTVEELAALTRDDVAVVDVRGIAEWEAGHLPGVPNIPLGMLGDRLDEIPTDRPVVVQCLSGARSAIAASVLRAKGFANVANLVGGFEAWRSAGLGVETPPTAQDTRRGALAGAR
ncbi:MAG TPA: rhodanese-like domain-containing protein [Gemmatimonadaceae bacterium]